MTLSDFRVWLRVLAAAKASIPAALVLRRLQELGEEAGGQADADPMLDETLEAVRRAVSSDTDKASVPEVSPDPESKRSPWLGPYHRFDWVLDTLPEVTFSDHRWTILKYPYGRREAIDSARGSCLTLRRGAPFPGDGRIGQADVPNQDLAALHRIGGDPRALIFVRPSVTLVEPYTVVNLRETLLSDHRPWAMYRRHGAHVSNLGEVYLWPVGDRDTCSGFDISDSAEPLGGMGDPAGEASAIFRSIEPVA